MPLHVVVNGVVVPAINADINLDTNYAPLIQDHVTESLMPVGFPSLKELVSSCVEQDVPIFD